MSTESKVTIHFIVLLIFIMLFNVSYNAGINYGRDNNTYTNSAQGWIIDYDYNEDRSEAYITLDTTIYPNTSQNPYCIKITDLTIFNSEEFMNKMYAGDVLYDFVLVYYEKYPDEKEYNAVLIRQRNVDLEWGK